MLPRQGRDCSIIPVEIAFAGLTPEFIGLMQVNLKVPFLLPGSYPLVVAVKRFPLTPASVVDTHSRVATVRKRTLSARSPTR